MPPLSFTNHVRKKSIINEGLRSLHKQTKSTSYNDEAKNIWDKVFKNGPSKKLEVIWSFLTYHFKFFKGCPPQILLGLFVNISSHFFNYILLKLISICICLRLHWITYDNIKQLISILNFELFPLKVKTFLVKWFSYFNLHFVSVTVYLPKYIHVLNSCSWYDLWFKVAF